MASEANGRKQVRLRMFSIIDRTDVSPSVQPILAPGTLLVSFETVDDSTGRTMVAGKYLTLRPRPADAP
jgi:hypothetical protein